MEYIDESTEKKLKFKGKLNHVCFQVVTKKNSSSIEWTNCRVLWTECAGIQSSPSLRCAHQNFLNSLKSIKDFIFYKDFYYLGKAKGGISK